MLGRRFFSNPPLPRNHSSSWTGGRIRQTQMLQRLHLKSLRCPCCHPQYVNPAWLCPTGFCGCPYGRRSIGRFHDCKPMAKIFQSRNSESQSTESEIRLLPTLSLPSRSHSMSSPNHSIFAPIAFVDLGNWSQVEYWSSGWKIFR